MVKNWVVITAVILAYLGYFMPIWIGLIWAFGIIIAAYLSPLAHPFF